MSSSKFPERRDGVYYLDGQEYVSVTEVLRVLAKPALINWAARQTAKAILADPYKYDTSEKATTVITGIKDDATERGRGLHEAINRWAESGTLPELGSDPYVNGFLFFMRAWTPIPVYSEVVVFNQIYKYAGKLDMIAKMGTETWLLDYKTSRGIYPEMGLQLTAYRNATMMKLPDGTVVPMTMVDHTGIVSLPGNGSFDFKMMDEPFEVFLALMRVHEWVRNRD